MFEVGERVVCVDDGPDERTHKKTGAVDYYPSGLMKGRTYVVADVYRPKAVFWSSLFSAFFVTKSLGVAVGIDNMAGFDWHRANRFRKLRNLDTSQSLQALIDLPNKVKNGELVDG